MDEYTITEAALAALGFHRVHINPNWNGGYLKFIRDVPAPPRISIEVTFGDVYCLRDAVPLVVWIECEMTSIALRHIKTMDQLAQLWQLIAGCPIQQEVEA